MSQNRPLVKEAEREHLAHLRALLELEAAAEVERAKERNARLSPADAERVGISLIDLVVEDAYGGLGGLYVLKLAKRTMGLALPWSRIGPGDPVVVARHEDGEPIARGVVSAKRDRHLAVAVAEPPEFDDDLRLRVDRASDEVTTKRQRHALSRVESATDDRLARLREVLIGGAEPESGEAPPIHADLNDAQRRAVAMAMAADDLALIHGPPGTGKTKAVVALIVEAVAKKQTVLACAPSNLAVDNIVERLAPHGLDVVRLGHPARILPSVYEASLASRAEKHDDVRLSRNLVKEALKLYRKSDKETRTRMARRERQELRKEAKQLMKDARRLERDATERILANADVVCATTSIDDDLLKRHRFDLAVVDEAAQSTEPGTWPPLLYADKVVLAGDHQQLPPTIISAEAARGGYGVSLFERAVAMHPTAAVRLEQQYRMNEAIMTFSSQELYDGALVADPSVASHRLKDLEHVAEDPLTDAPLELIDSAGAGWSESVEPDGESRLNEEEAKLAAKKVEALLALGVLPTEVGVITPYAAQARRIRELIDAAEVEVDTVDGFQGREKEAIVISLVRSNEDQEIGFLGDVRRMNVALTRARRKLLIIGDSATLCSDAFYERLFAYVESNGVYGTVWDEL